VLLQLSRSLGRSLTCQCGRFHTPPLPSTLILTQNFMQQLLVNIVQAFPHQALWAMAVVVKSTVRARQVCVCVWLLECRVRGSAKCVRQASSSRPPNQPNPTQPIPHAPSAGGGHDGAAHGAPEQPTRAALA
jgi:hypothetical protein